MKKAISLLFVFFISFMHIVSAAGDNNTDTYGTGLIWEDIEGLYEGEQPPAEETLPTAVDISDTFPTPGNQGSQNSCVAWAAAYALMSHQEQMRRDWGLDTNEHIFSPSYIYNQVSNGSDNGTSPTVVLDMLKRQGVCTLASFPYDAADYTTQPTMEQTAEAVNYRIHNHSKVYGTNAVKQRLANGDGVIICINVFPDFRTLSPSNPIYDTADGTYSGSHSVCLVGYDDSRNAFKFINSWGTAWGLDGYGWISYDILENSEVNQYGRAVGFVMEPRGTDEFTEGFFDYTVSYEEAEVCSYFGSDKYVKIPEMFSGFPVTGIGDEVFAGDLYYGGNPIESVGLPSTLKHIGAGAFKNCPNLSRIRISDGTEEIGNSAFENCLSLTELVVPDSIAYIGADAFCKTTSGEPVTLDRLTFLCSENSYAHKYALENGISFEIVDLDARMIETTALSNDADVMTSYVKLTRAPDETYTLTAYYIPPMLEMPLFCFAAYNGDKMMRAIISKDSETISGISENELKNCKIFIWTQNMQPCIMTVEGDIKRFPKLY